MTMPTLDKQPTPDPAEFGAYFPSPFSLSQFTAPRSDLADADYATPYRGGRWKILMVCADERYVPMQGGKLFSSGNHPVETLVPLYHLVQAGFEIDVATLSGNPVKFEMWAMPQEDAAIVGLHARLLDQFRRPLRLAEVLDAATAPDSDYLGVFIPGGHGALVGLPDSSELGQLLRWAMGADRFVITLCHGPAALLAAAAGQAGQEDPFVFDGYTLCGFPDAVDRQTPDIGYMPGQLPWFYGERLVRLGMTFANAEVTGAVHRDRKLLTGDSPMAANALGKLAATTLLAAVQQG